MDIVIRPLDSIESPIRKKDKTSKHKINNYCKQCQEIVTDDKIRFFGEYICDQCYTYTCCEFHNQCLNIMHKCCICKDLRQCLTNVHGYKGYDDSIGYVENRSRWEYYCSSCKLICENLLKDRNC